MEEQRYSYARDGFIYLLSYATLLISSVGLNFLLKAITNRFIPDAIEQYNFLSDDSTLIGFLAAVIIAFPIFVYLNFLANRMLGQGKMRHDSGVRNWLLYITLVVVILIIIWQVIMLFISFLNGTLIARFAIHTLITLLITAAILGYQWWHLRFFDGTTKPISSGFKIFEWVVIAVVVGTIVGTFFIIDSPAERRVKRLDSIRVERLSSIRGSIQSFYGWEKDSGRGRLPQDLAELERDTRVRLMADGLVDPVTKEQFEYQIVSSTTYELCATFDTEFREGDNSQATFVEPRSPDGQSKVFYHGIGRECFELNVSLD